MYTGHVYSDGSEQDRCNSIANALELHFSGTKLSISFSILINFGSGNGLLPDGTKPLPEPNQSWKESLSGMEMHQALLAPYQVSHQLLVDSLIKGQ